MVLSSASALQPQLALAAALHIVLALLVFCALGDRAVRVPTVITALCAGLVPAVALGAWQVIAGSSGSSTMLGLAARNAQTLGDAVVMIHGQRVLRAYGTFPHPNIFGGFLAVALVLWHTIRRNVPTTMYWMMGLMLATGLILTASRSAILGLVVAIIVILLRRQSTARRTTIALVAIALAMTTTFAAPGFASLVRGGGATEDRSIDERAAQYADYGLLLSSTNLLVGHGIGNYVFMLAHVYQDREWWQYQPIHNVPFLLLAETGIFGLAALAFWFKVHARFHAVLFLLLTIAVFDHYLWTTWAGLALTALCVAVTER
jgi:O-antigen ligase